MAAVHGSPAAGSSRREPGAVVLHAAEVGAGAGPLVDAVELGGDHAVDGHGEARRTRRGAGEAAVVGAQQEPAAQPVIHHLDVVVVRVGERVAGQVHRGARGRAHRRQGDPVQLRPAHVDDGRIGGMAGDGVVVPALGAQPVGLGAALGGPVPGGAAVPRHPQLAVARALGRGVQVLVVHRRDRHLEAAAEVGDAVVRRRSRCGPPSVDFRMPAPKTVAYCTLKSVGSATSCRMRGPLKLSVPVSVCTVGPARAAVRGAEDVGRGVQGRLVGARGGGRQHDARRVRRHDDPRHVVEGGVALGRGQRRPGRAAVRGLEDPVAVHGVDVEEALAGAGVEDVVVQRIHGQGLHRQLGHGVGQGRPGGAAVGGVPHAAAHRRDEPGQAGGIVRIDHDAAGAAGHVAGAAVLPDQGLVRSHGRPLGLGQGGHAVAGRVLGGGAVARDLHLPEDAGELVRGVGLGLFLGALAQGLQLLPGGHGHAAAGQGVAELGFETGLFLEQHGVGGVAVGDQQQHGGGGGRGQADQESGTGHARHLGGWGVRIRVNENPAGRCGRDVGRRARRRANWTP